MARHPNVVHESDLEPRQALSTGGFQARYRSLADAAGGKEIGCSLYEVPAGKAAYPYHWHGANEEAVIILAGEGVMRIGGKDVEVRAGDYIAFPTGPDHSHQLVATTDMKYYCLSTRKGPEVCGYPDSKKVSVMVGPWKKPDLRAVFREDTQAGYLDDEPRAGKD